MGNVDFIHLRQTYLRVSKIDPTFVSEYYAQKI